MCNFFYRQLIVGSLTVLFGCLVNLHCFANNNINNETDITFYPFANIKAAAAGDTIAYQGLPVICAGSELSLSLQNVQQGSSVKWFRDGNLIQGANAATYPASVAGTYSATVTFNGSVYTYPSLRVTAASNPVASFTFPPGIPCSADAVQFTSTSTGGNLTYLWNFGDPNSKKSNTSTLANPSHTFVGTVGNGTQTFTVTLTVTNKYGCSNTFKSTVTLLQAPDTNLGGEGATVYNGLAYFVSCTNQPTKFTFINTSTTKNLKYNLYWGDGSGQTTVSSFSSIAHTYRVGSYNLFCTVYGANGCSITHKYHIFVGTSPKIAFAPPATTSFCTGTNAVIKIINATNNTPGTIYTATYTDGTINAYGSASTSVLPPDTIMHTFNKNSVGKTTTKNGKVISNAYGVIITALNPCGTAADTIAPLYVSDVPNIKLTLLDQPVTCVGSQIRFKNESDSAFFASATGAGVDKFVWKITPATGFVADNRSMGSYTSLTDPDSWTSGTKNLKISFTAPGSYRVTLITGNNCCGVDSASKVICVNAPPTASFDLDNITGCAPLIVSTKNTSNMPNCGNHSFNWTVTYTPDACAAVGAGQYTFLNNTDARSADPQFQFTDPGVYTLTLTHTNSLGSCSAAVFSKTVTVFSPAMVRINSPAQVYVGQAFRPQGVVNGCDEASGLTYLWTFNGANYQTSTLSNPDSVSYANVGQYLIALAVTNTCGITTVYKSVNVVLKPLLYIPNTITPNNDGINDTWNIKGLEDEPVLVQVFNRYGSLLFERQGLYQPWDGTYLSSRLPTGVYYYVIQTLKTKRRYSGTVALIY